MNRWKKYLVTEIGIEFKACLYFYCLLFFYAVYLILKGKYSMPISIMAEMILTSYLIGYIQVYLLENFDEAEKIRRKEFFSIIAATMVYIVVSFVGSWFHKELRVTVIFGVYMIFVYFCVFWIYKIKRNLETKELNHMLADFKKRGME